MFELHPWLLVKQKHLDRNNIQEYRKLWYSFVYWEKKGEININRGRMLLLKLCYILSTSIIAIKEQGDSFLATRSCYLIPTHKLCLVHNSAMAHPRSYMDQKRVPVLITATGKEETKRGTLGADLSAWWLAPMAQLRICTNGDYY